MNFSDWKALGADERKTVKLHRRPHIKTATLFTTAFIVLAVLVILRIGKNETKHLNGKPDAGQAYQMAQNFVKDKLKLPASAGFPKSKYDASIDTATSIYLISGIVNAQSTNGLFEKQKWTAKLKFLGGDWADKGSWQAQRVDIE